jgi:hypothetical protein
MSVTWIPRNRRVISFGQVTDVFTPQADRVEMTKGPEQCPGLLVTN